MRRAAVGAVAALLLVVPLLLGAGAGQYVLHVLIQIFIWSFVGQAWSLMGRFGLVSLGHGAFLGLGAYMVALLWNFFRLTPWIGAEGVDCAFESYLSAVAVMDRVLAYDAPYDAVVLAGFGEHGRDGLQELIAQPVVEICEASAHMAMLVGRSYSVVTTLQRSVPAIEDRLKLGGLIDRCASIRANGMSTMELDADPAGAVRSIVEEARKAVEVDRAEAICLGCAGMARAEEAPGRRLVDINASRWHDSTWPSSRSAACSRS